MERNELLEASRDAWAESAKHDKFQALGSFGCAATGILAAGIGVGLILSKHPEGLLLLGGGGGAATYFAREGISEMNSFAEMSARSESMQQKIEMLNKTEEALQG